MEEQNKGQPQSKQPWRENTASDEARAEVDFETIRSEKIFFGKNNFIEVARKKAVTKEGASEFISVSRGYKLADGTERFKKSVTIPDDKATREFIADRIRSM
jgi:hypothetical protein